MTEHPVRRLHRVLPAGGVRTQASLDAVEVMGRLWTDRNRVTADWLRSVHEAALAGIGGAPMESADRFSADEIAPVLGCSPQVAGRWVELATDVIVRLPMVHAAMAAGWLDEAKARALSEWTRDLCADHARRVVTEALVDAAAAPTGLLIERVQELAIAIDPGWAARREARARRRARVVGALSPEGTASLSGYDLPVEEAVIALSRLEGLADQVRAAGVDMPIAQLRSVVFLRLLGPTGRGLEDAALVDLLVEELRDHGPNDTGPDGDGPDDPGPADPDPADPDPDDPDDPDDPGDGGPDDGGPDDGGPDDGGPDDGGPDDGGPDDGGPDEGGPDDGGPDGPEGPEDGGPEDGGPDPDDSDSPGGPDDGGPDVGPDDVSPADMSPANDRWPGAPGGLDIGPDGDPRRGPDNEADPSDGGPGNGGLDDGGSGDAGHGGDSESQTEPSEPARSEPARSEPVGSEAVGSEAVAEDTLAGPAPGFEEAAPPNRGLRRGTTELRVRWSTVLGLDEHPARIPTWGPVLAATARQWVEDHPNAEWRIVLTDDAGHLRHVLLTRRRPPPIPEHPHRHSHRRRPRSSARGIIELQISMRALRALDPDAHPRWRGLLTAVQARLSELPPDGSPDHRSAATDAAGRRRAHAELDRWVRTRDRRCVAPGCSRPARVCDLDHTRAWAEHGPSAAWNLGALCRRHHRLKHEGGWTLRQPRPGHFRWRTRAGHLHDVTARPVTDPLPDPAPRPGRARPLGPDRVVPAPGDGLQPPPTVGPAPAARDRGPDPTVLVLVGAPFVPGHTDPRNTPPPKRPARPNPNDDPPPF